ncbi:hypothetical protein SY88_08460 [Clostridiales bacterium PH28_bin88]|nr:hypothetical protein SY88_08460 [Clostridiales bacterium PH28_bin88]
MLDNPQVSLGLAFVAGLVSFVSPCVLPLIPTYLSYLTGVSVRELTIRQAPALRARVWWNALAFIGGFSLVFIAFGLSVSTLGQLLAQHQALLRRASGALIVLFGLHMTGLIKIGVLQRERRTGYTPRRAGILNSLLMGMAFSAGWTPCIGPVLGSILLLAGNSGSVWAGGYLLAAYSLGLAVPFLTAALAVEPLMKRLRRYSHLLPLVSVAGGVLMIVVGVMVFTNYFSRLSGLLYFNI